MYHWKAIAFVTLVSITPIIIALPIIVKLQQGGGRLRLIYATFLVACYIRFLYAYTFRIFTNPLRHLPCAPYTQFLWGNASDYWGNPPSWPLITLHRSVPNDGLIRLSEWWHWKQTLILTKPELVKQALSDNGCYTEKAPRIREFFSRILGDGLLAVEGSRHKFQRKSLSPAFSGRVIKDLVPIMWEKSNELADFIAQKIGDTSPEAEGVLELNSLASQITLDIIGVACLGRDFRTLHNADDELAKTYAELLEDPKVQRFYAISIIFGKTLTSLIPFWPLKDKVSHNEHKLRKICRQLLEECRTTDSKNPSNRNIISTLLRSSTQLTEDDLISQLLTFLAAGHETTSNALTWTCYLLAKHPDVQTALRKEINAHLHSPGTTHAHSQTSNITPSTFETLPLLDATCKESLRLYPPAPRIRAISTRPSTLHLTNGAAISIPTGTGIAVSAVALQRDPSLWGPDADTFRPSRWLDGSANTNPFAFVAFSHGARSCIGQEFARTELRCLVAALAGRFEMGLTSREEPVAFGLVTMKPRGGMFLRFREVGGRDLDEMR